MSAVPPRQIAVLSVSNFEDLSRSFDARVAGACVGAVRSCAIECGVHPDHMRVLRGSTLLCRLDDLPTEEFLARVQVLGERTKSLAVPGYPQAEPQIRVIAMSERAQRSIVDDTALSMLSYMGHTGGRVAFLTGDDANKWRDYGSGNVEFITFEQLKGIDPVTGLMTPYRFAMLLQDVLNDDRLRSVCSVLYFDIEDFKSYNRAFGRPLGDELLHFAANLIRESFEGDIVGHIAIDRFVVATSAADITARVLAIYNAVRDFSKDFAPEMKCGIYKARHGRLESGIAMDWAKLACESIKGSYGVAYREFDAEMERHVNVSQYVLHHVEQALSEGWIHVYYQPVVSATTGELRGYEALARWQDPVLGLMPPTTFVPVLEEARTTHMIDLYVVRQVCERLAKWKAEGHPLVSVSVNLSRTDFMSCDVVDEVCRIRDEYGIAPDLIDIEVTESALIDNDTHLRHEMERFRSAGHEVWMDDFGSGYSSLNLLKDFEFDVLKIDMAFLQAVDANTRAQEILVAVVQMAKRLGLCTLVEGVETVAQRDFMREAGCDLMQGFLFGRPAPIE